jgi:hypothetical protein
MSEKTSRTAQHVMALGVNVARNAASPPSLAMSSPSPSTVLLVVVVVSRKTVYSSCSQHDNRVSTLNSLID